MSEKSVNKKMHPATLILLL